MKIFALLSVIIVYYFSRPYNLFASSNNWVQTDLKTGDGHIIKFAFSDKNIGYATSQNPISPHVYKTLNGGLNWFSFDNGISSGYVADSLVIDYSNPNHAYVGLYDGDVYETLDSSSWTKKGSPGSEIRSMAIDPNNATILYAGTNGGIYKSMNSGASWQRIGDAIVSGNVMYISVSKSPNSSKIICATGENAYISNDYGLTWENISIFDTVGTNGAINIDPDNYDNIYFAAGKNKGLWGSVDGGVNWINLIGSYDPFEIAIQIINGKKYVFTSSRYSNSGVYKYNTADNTYENITGNLGWAYKWGLDSNEFRVCVFNSIYYEVDGGIWCLNHEFSTPSPIPTPTPTPTPTPEPKVVFIPGFGGSTNWDALIRNKTVDQSEWFLTPIKTAEYKAILQTFKNAGLVEGDTLLPFYYDWRQPVKKSGKQLLEFLNNYPGGKFNILGHSLGGLVARSCLEFEPECKEKINKIITAGSPHRGAVGAYYLWNGVIPSEDPLIKIFGELLIGLNRKNLRVVAPSIGNFLPIFDYINWHSYSVMDPINKNPYLESLPNNNGAGVLTTFSGNLPSVTPEKLAVYPPSTLLLRQDLWLDGVPFKKFMGTGDNTVLDSSAAIPGLDNFKFSSSHPGLVGDTQPQQKILDLFELSTPDIMTGKEGNNPFTWFILKPKEVTSFLTTSHNQPLPAPQIFNVTCFDNKNNLVFLNKLEDNVIVGENLTVGRCRITVDKNLESDFEVFIGDINQNDSNWQIIKGSANKGLRRWYKLNRHFFHPCFQFERDE